MRGRARKKLNALIASKLDTARAWELKEASRHLWKYKSPLRAGGFLDAWCECALRSRLEPTQKVARLLRNQEEQLVNWFRAKGQLSSGSVEGLNNKTRVATRRAYGFRTFNATEIALYQTLGRLPEPECAHRFPSGDHFWRKEAMTAPAPIAPGAMRHVDADCLGCNTMSTHASNACRQRL